MRVMLSAALSTTLAAIVAGCASTPDKDPVQLKLNDLDERMTKIVANQVELSQRLDNLEGSLREMHGHVDELEHGSDALTKQQRDLYGDLQKRLAALGAGAGAVAGAASGGGDNEAAGEAGTNAPSSTEQAVYGQAFDALKAGSYSTAITGFKDFLHNYPDSSLADNAQYWLGEAYYVNHEYDAAAGAFKTVLKKWPDSQKAPDALLKLGYTQFEQKQYPTARATLDEVTKKYPGTPSAKLAADRLRRIPAQSGQP